MKRLKKWEKPEVGILAHEKPSVDPGKFQTRDIRSYLGPAPAPPVRCPLPRESCGYIGPTPAPTFNNIT